MPEYLTPSGPVSAAQPKPGWVEMKPGQGVSAYGYGYSGRGYPTQYAAGPDTRPVTWEYGLAPIGPFGLDPGIWQMQWESQQRQAQQAAQQKAAQQQSSAIAAEEARLKATPASEKIIQVKKGQHLRETGAKQIFMSDWGTYRDAQGRAYTGAQVSQMAYQQRQAEARLGQELRGGAKLTKVTPTSYEYTRAPAAAPKQLVSYKPAAGLPSFVVPPQMKTTQGTATGLGRIFTERYDTSVGEIRTVKTPEGKPIVQTEGPIGMGLVNLAAGFGGEEKFKREMGDMAKEGFSAPLVTFRALQYGPLSGAVKPEEYARAGIESALIFAPGKVYSIAGKPFSKLAGKVSQTKAGQRIITAVPGFLKRGEAVGYETKYLKSIQQRQLSFVQGGKLKDVQFTFRQKPATTKFQKAALYARDIIDPKTGKLKKTLTMDFARGRDGFQIATESIKPIISTKVSKTAPQLKEIIPVMVKQETQRAFRAGKEGYQVLKRTKSSALPYADELPGMVKPLVKGGQPSRNYDKWASDMSKIGTDFIRKMEGTAPSARGLVFATAKTAKSAEPAIFTKPIYGLGAMNYAKVGRAAPSFARMVSETKASAAAGQFEGLKQAYSPKKGVLSFSEEPEFYTRPGDISGLGATTKPATLKQSRGFDISQMIGTGAGLMSSQKTAMQQESRLLTGTAQALRSAPAPDTMQRQQQAQRQPQKQMQKQRQALKQRTETMARTRTPVFPFGFGLLLPVLPLPGFRLPSFGGQIRKRRPKYGYTPSIAGIFRYEWSGGRYFRRRKPGKGEFYGTELRPVIVPELFKVRRSKS